METVEVVPGEWVSVSEASQVAGVPVRTTYRWVKAGRLASRKEGRTVQVDLGALQELARVTPRHANLPGNVRHGTGNGAVAEPAGAVAGRVFALFEGGVAPAEVVRQEQLPPQVVLDLHRQFTSLQELGGGQGTPPTSERLTALERAVKAIRQEAKDAMAEVGTFYYAMEDRLVALERAKSAALVASCASCGTQLSRVYGTCQGCTTRAEMLEMMTRGPQV